MYKLSIIFILISRNIRLESSLPSSTTESLHCNLHIVSIHPVVIQVLPNHRHQYIDLSRRRHGPGPRPTPGPDLDLDLDLDHDLDLELDLDLDLDHRDAAKRYEDLL